MRTCEMHELYTDKGCQTDIDGVDKEQIERPEEIWHLPCGKPIAHRTERRHEGRGDGNAGNHIAFVFRCYREDAGTSSEKAD